ncbi:MAG: cyclase family protein [Planctomycetes bacterium]|nr:cyclase family protein [Planctomycetota bacterium]
MNTKQIVDLSHPLIPGKTSRKFNIQQVGAETVAPVQRLADQWYIMHNIEMVNHIGTHVEMPYHLRRDGADLLEFPVERTLGPARVLDIGSPPPGTAVGLDDLKQAARRAGGVQPGEVVLVRTGWSDRFDTPEYLKSPWFRAEGLSWLVDQGMVMLGVESGGVEELSSTTHESHYALFDRGVPLIENLANMQALGDRKQVICVCTPLAIGGLEAFPIRVLAILDPWTLGSPSWFRTRLVKRPVPPHGGSQAGG